MNIYGYALEEFEGGLLKLSEASISASPKTLRELADFILKCAERIEKDGKRFNHEHFYSDELDEYSSEFIVLKQDV